MINSRFPLLDQIDSVADLQQLELSQLPELCDEIRHYLVESISKSSGHFASNLGTVELTVALHYVYSSPSDKIIWDVGHQAYTHKLLTGRKDRLSTIRSLGGLHPFPFRQESEHDILTVGHSSTSISVAVGLSLAQSLLPAEQRHDIVPVIGDGAMTAGMVFEALNHAGEIKTPLTIVFNDNNMSISANRGAINKHTDRIFSSNLYQDFRNKTKEMLPNLPLLKSILKNTESTLKHLFSPEIAQLSKLYDTFGIDYIGPVDGHDVIALVEKFRSVKGNQKLQLVHVLTTKGKGYQPAEADPIKYHGVGKFEPELDKIGKSSRESLKESHKESQATRTQASTFTEENKSFSCRRSYRDAEWTLNCAVISNYPTIAEDSTTLWAKGLKQFYCPVKDTNAAVLKFPNVGDNLSESTFIYGGSISTPESDFTYSQIFGKWLVLHRFEPGMVAVTPAMCEGSGMQEYAKLASERFVDVAIAEQHAVSLATGLAIAGMKPVVAIYSTFLQRAYDQLIHDVAIDNHNVLFAVDRAGIVGEDGQTHQGAFDISYLRCIPNVNILTPSNAYGLEHALNYAYEQKGTWVVRYPRGKAFNPESAEFRAFREKLGDRLKIEDSKFNPYRERFDDEMFYQVLKRDPEVRVEKPIAFVNFGTIINKGLLELAVELNADVYDVLSVKHLDKTLLDRLSRCRLIVTTEENSVVGGAGTALLEALTDANIFKPILRIGIEDQFIEPINTNLIDQELAWDYEGLKAKVLAKLDSISPYNYY